ncbi:oxidoreductase [Ignatzschineria rhizosphaerae]|uniref:Oxidoreductase n=1 Tax=Ignatzschineria rhizosphaerae TaxID=2923279 RepID=A0ABY3X515_9GAMM|nr:MDR family oxidoreductase [Ignatzschineria rhizosphaerae]UNM96985.1 oxidoreductase [Ignatzschineria rhizosphaerae]
MFKALYLQDEQGFSCTEQSIPQAVLRQEEGDTLVKVHYSTLNYKDALAITNTGKIARRFPMIPGIDFAGEVVETTDSTLKVGDQVFMNGLGLSENHFGGLAEFTYVPAKNLLKVPKAYQMFDVMAFGTAGYTAALCVNRLLQHGIKPEAGEVLVSGASGGVGMVAMMLLSKLGFEAVALSSKVEEEVFFKSLGATRIESAASFYETGGMLQKSRFQAAVDVLGSIPLANICAQLKYSGIVAACGLARGMDFPGNMAPFILRDVTLAGVDSVMAPKEKRIAAWQLLSENIRSEEISQSVKTIHFDQVIEVSEKMIAGKIQGRFVVKIA